MTRNCGLLLEKTQGLANVAQPEAFAMRSSSWALGKNKRQRHEAPCEQTSIIKIPVYVKNDGAYHKQTERHCSLTL